MAATRSWWVGLSRESFAQAVARETPRMERADMKVILPTMADANKSRGEHKRRVAKMQMARWARTWAKGRF